MEDVDKLVGDPLKPKCSIAVLEVTGVQGVLTLFCSGAAEVCHDDRVVELKEARSRWKEDGDRSGGRGRRKREKSNQGDAAHDWCDTAGFTMNVAQNLQP